MARKEILDRIEKYVDPFRITKGKGFKLKDFDPAETCGLTMGKGEAAELLQRGTEWLAEEQDMLYAQNRWALLLVFQAMDAAGKDGTIKHVMSGVNPQGCQVFSFKQPSSEDLDHDFLWRYFKGLPERGRIGIFNRSYYEEVLVVRVHEDILKRQKLPRRSWPRASGTSGFPTSRTSRITSLGRGRSFSSSSYTCRVRSRRSVSWSASTGQTNIGSSRPLTCMSAGSGGDYMHAFQEAIRATASKRAPWYVVPADNKWFTRLLVAAAIVEAMENLDLAYPAVDAKKQKELQATRAALSGGK